MWDKRKMSFNDIARNNSNEVRPAQPVNISRVPASLSGVNSIATADASIHRIGDLLRTFQVFFAILRVDSVLSDLCRWIVMLRNRKWRKFVWNTWWLQLTLASNLHYLSLIRNNICRIDKLVQRLRGSENNVKIQVAENFITSLCCVTKLNIS